MGDIAAARRAAAAAAERISARLREQTCVVCLQPCPGPKSCRCSFMHKDCAISYIEKLSKTCRVCEQAIEPSRLSKRPCNDEQDDELERRSKKRMREKEAAERKENLRWARAVAPAAAHIYFRHFRHARADGEEGATELCFSSVLLSLIHSDEAYLEDLSEKLCETRPSHEVRPTEGSPPRP